MQRAAGAGTTIIDVQFKLGEQIKRRNTNRRTCSLPVGKVPLAWSGAGYIRWIFGYCSNRLDILRSRASARGSAKSPRKLRLRSGVDDVSLTVELSIGERVAGRCRPCSLSALFFEFRFWFFEFLFFFLLTSPTVYVGMTETAFPLLFFLPACTTTVLVAFVLFLTIGFLDGIGSFLVAGVVVPYNVRDQSCNVARPDTESGFTSARVSLLDLHLSGGPGT